MFYDRCERDDEAWNVSGLSSRRRHEGAALVSQGQANGTSRERLPRCLTESFTESDRLFREDCNRDSPLIAKKFNYRTNYEVASREGWGVTFATLEGGERLTPVPQGFLRNPESVTKLSWRKLHMMANYDCY